MVLVAVSVWQIVLIGDLIQNPDYMIAAVTAPSMLVFAIGYIAWLFVTTRIDSRYFSSVSIGAARLKVRISAFSIALQQLVYVVLLTVFFIVFGFIALVIMGGMTTGLEMMGGAGNSEDLSQLMRAGSSTFFVLIGLYLVFLGLWGVLSELVLAFGYWKIVARGSQIENIAGLSSVRAAGTESPLAGEGLADALNVGAY
jgi:hypothetical protein